MSFADEVTIETYNLVSLIVKIVLLKSQLVFSLLLAAKIQCFAQLWFNSTLQLINSTLSDLQKLLKYFNGAAIFTFFRIPFAAAVLPIN